MFKPNRKNRFLFKDVRKSGYVYVMNLGFEGLYKIGHTVNLKTRLSNLQASNPHIKKEMAFQVLDRRKVEKFLHNRYKDFHHSKELFSLNEKQLSWIRDYLRAERKRFLCVKNGACPKCGSYMVLRKGKYGHFYGCSKFPACYATVSVSAMKGLTNCVTYSKQEGE